MNRWRSDRSEHGDSGRQSRGQSEVLGVVLLLSLTIIGATAITVMGASVLDDTQAQVGEGNAEQAMTQLDSKVSLVAFDSSQSQEVTVSSGVDGTTEVRPDAGNVNVTFVPSDGDNVTIVDDEPLGEIVYEDDDTKVAYQGGGVWKHDGENAHMVSPPEFHYRVDERDQPTLTLPLVTVRGEESSGDSVQVDDADRVPHFPDPDEPDLVNPLGDGSVYLTLETEYAEAWAEFFEERTQGEVEYVTEDEVKIQLRIEQEIEGVEGGIVATSASAGELRIQPTVDIDAYNSSEGDYAASNSESARIAAATPVEMQPNSVIEGSVIARQVDLGGGGGGGGGGPPGGGGVGGGGGGGEITGDVICPSEVGETDCVTPNDDNVGGDVYSEGSAPSAPVFDISREVERYEDSEDNDNDETDLITEDNELDLSEGDTLEAGSYYVEEFEVDDALTLNATSENVTIAVDGNVYINDELDVAEGDGVVRIFSTGGTIDIHDDVTVPEDRSYRMWIYGTPGTIVEFDDMTFVGVVYAPDDGASDGSIRMETHADIYGGIVGPVDQLQPQGGLHFDEALLDSPPVVTEDDMIARVTYLHVTTNTVNATAM